VSELGPRAPIDIRAEFKRAEISAIDDQIGELMSMRAGREEELAALYAEAQQTLRDYADHKSTIDEARAATIALELVQ
jgi:hypothetical protein